MFLVPSEARWVRLRNSRTQAATPSIPRRYMDLRWKVVGEFKPFGVHVPHDPVRVIRLWPQPLFSSLKVRLSVTRRSPFADAGVLGLSLADPHPRRLPTRGSFGTWWAFFPISLKGCGPVKAGRTTQQSYRQGVSSSGEPDRGRSSRSVFRISSSYRCPLTSFHQQHSALQLGVQTESAEGQHREERPVS